jgi:hypothetical protein
MFGPTFGGGWGMADLLIAGDTNRADAFPSHFRPGCAYGASGAILNFTVREMEVFEARVDPLEDRFDTVILSELPPLLSQFHGMKQTLLYRASRDCRDRADFHRLCDDQVAVLCIVCADTDDSLIVGWFTPMRFGSDGGVMRDHSGESFALSLNGQSPYRMSVLPGSHSVIWDASLGIEFSDSYGTDQTGLSIRAHCYSHSGSSEQSYASAGDCREIEVFQVLYEKTYLNLSPWAIDSAIVLSLPFDFEFFRWKRINLISRSSRDGFTAQDFHREWDGFCRTIVLIGTPEGYIFGGYSPCR